MYFFDVRVFARNVNVYMMCETVSACRKFFIIVVLRSILTDVTKICDSLCILNLSCTLDHQLHNLCRFICSLLHILRTQNTQDSSLTNRI
jgi:hypothetical protein